MQHGDEKVVDDYSLLWSPKYSKVVTTKSPGYISNINSRQIGWALIEVGAGRRVLSDKIDHSAGLVFAKKIGDKVEKGEKIATLYFNNNKGKSSVEMIEKAISVSKSQVKRKSRILGFQ